MPEPPKPFICPICYKELVMAGSNMICPYNRVIVTFKSIKDIEVVHYTAKELEKIEEDNKAKNKAKHIEEARKQHQEDIIKQEETKSS